MHGKHGVHLAARLGALSFAVLLAACGGDGNKGTAATVTAAAFAPAPATAPAGQPVAGAPEVVVTDTSGSPVAGVEVRFAVMAGGGSVQSARTRTDAAGRATTVWRLGPAPVANRVRASAGGSDVDFATVATLAAPLEPVPFGDVDAFLSAEGIAGSTEDIAFDADGRVVLGVPGGLIALDAGGNASTLALRGDRIGRALGIDFDAGGNLWVADSLDRALRRVAPDGTVTTAFTEPLQFPNFTAVGPDGRVYVSDLCLGQVLRWDPSSATIDAVLSFDLPAQGGPNGFAFSPDDGRLRIVTMNTALSCGTPFVGVGDAIAGVYDVEVSDAGFGSLRPVVENFSLIGDGATFDAEGNFYVVFDDFGTAGLQTTLWVVPAGESGPVLFLESPGRLMANPAFGRDDFGRSTLYIALVTIPPLSSPNARGVERIEVGIAGPGA